MKLTLTQRMKFDKLLAKAREPETIQFLKEQRAIIEHSKFSNSEDVDNWISYIEGTLKS